MKTIINYEQTDGEKINRYNNAKIYVMNRLTNRRCNRCKKPVLKSDITTRELQELLGYTNVSGASNKMMQIKRVVGDRLGVKGKIHTEDYFAYFEIYPDDRYNRLTSNRELSERELNEYIPQKLRTEQKD